MSQENAEIVRKGYDLYNRGDLTGFVELFDPGATWDPVPDWPEVQTRHGREEIRRLVADIREPLDRNEAVAERLVEGGAHVVTDHVWRGVVKGTEDEVAARVGLMATLHAGKITEIRAFQTFDEALEAAGLRE